MNEIELKLDKKVIENQIESTIKEMAAIYQIEERIDGLKIEGVKGWSDADSKVGLINSCEALESFFIPYTSSNYFRNKFWKGELIDLSIIRNTIRYLLKDYREDPSINGDRGLSGSPYIDFTYKGQTPHIKSGIGKNYDFLDTAVFMLAALLDARLIDMDQENCLSEGIISTRQDPLIPDNLMKDWEKRASDAFAVVKECDTGTGGGWTYTNDPNENNRLDYLYFSWNALETLDVLKEYARDLPQLFPSAILDQCPERNIMTYINNIFIDKLSWLTGRFLSEKDAGDQFIPDKIIKFGEYGDQSIYYNLFALISLLIVDSRESDLLRKAIKKTTVSYLDKKSGIQKKIKQKNYGLFILEGKNMAQHEKEWQERAYYPLQIKAISYFIGKFKDNISELINEILSDESIKEEKEKVGTIDGLFSYYLKLLNDCKCTHIEDMNYRNIWDKVFEKSEYSIYYTQRTVEALCAVYRYYYPNDVPKFKIAERPFEKATAPISTGVGAPQITINIDNAILSDAMKRKILGEAENEIKGVLEKEKLSIEVELRESVEKIVEEKIANIIDEHIANTFEYIQNNLNTKEPVKKYKNLAKRMNEISGQCLSEIVYEALKANDTEGMKKIDRDDFKKRFNELLVYMVNLETARYPKEVLNYNEFISKLEVSGFFPYKKIRGGKNG